GRFRLRQAALRMAAHGARMRTATPAYILLDRVDAAGDNAEALFHHAVGHPPARPVFFCVAGSSPDYARLKLSGNVVAYGGLRHKIAMFRGAILVSSHASPSTFNPFRRDERFLADLIDIRRAFVSHGVMNT